MDLKYDALFYYDGGAESNIGKRTIRTKDAGQIATVTRNPGTNLFRGHVTGQKEGTINIEYEHTLSDKSRDDTECYSSVWTGLYVEVRRIGSIVNVNINRYTVPDH